MTRVFKSLAIVCVMVLTFCIMSSSGEAEPKVKTVYWSTSQAGTISYMLPAALSPIIWKYSNETIKIVPEPLRGTTQTVQRLHDKETDVGQAGANTAYEVYYAKGFFKGKKAWRGLRAMWPYTVSYHQCPLLKSNPINSIYDLKNARIRLPEKGSQGDSDARNMLRGAGYDLEKLDISWSTFSQAMDAIKDGHVDVFMCNAGMPSASIKELCTVREIKFLEIPEKVIRNANKIAYGGKNVYKYAEVVSKAGLYRGMQKGYHTMMNVYMNATRDSYDQEVVYQMTKIFWDHKDELDASYAPMKNVDKSYVGMIATEFLPIAEGSLRYYKEVGWIK